MFYLRAIFQLLRLETSILGFLAIFLPSIARTSDLSMSLGRAIPMLFICICTFIVNDLDDIERDRINHPDRPLPAGYFSPSFAVFLYFTSLALALFLTKYNIPSGIDFLYYGLIIVAISYGYIVEYVPILKSFYVAVAASMPILIVAALYPSEKTLYVVMGAVFLLTLGREMCMDIRDRAGDVASVIHGVDRQTLTITAFILQTAGTFLLMFLIQGVGHIVDLMVSVLLLFSSGIFWFKYKKYKLALILMKIQLFVGLYFLL